MSWEQEIVRLLEHIVHQNHEILREIRHLRPHKFTSTITMEGFEMSTSPTIPVPGTGVLTVNLFNADGSPYVVTAPFVPNWAWSLQPGSDPSITIVASSDTTTATITVPASDVATTVGVGASGLDPAGNAQTPSITLTLAASTAPTTFTSTITLTSSAPGVTASFRK